MKKLFYFLFLTPFLFSACSDDEEDYFTRDVEYSVGIQVVESYNQSATPQGFIYVHLSSNNWYIENYDCTPKISYRIDQSTLHIYLGELEYQKRTGGYPEYYVDTRTSVAPEYLWVYYPQIPFPSEISKIIVSRKEKQDIYHVEVSNDQLTIAPQQASFSHFDIIKYLKRPQNTFGVTFPYSHPVSLYDGFFELVSATVPITIYEYDSSLQPIWYLMRAPSDIYRVFSYENEEDYKTIMKIFSDYCIEASKEKKYFNAYMEKWTGEQLRYNISK